MTREYQRDDLTGALARAHLAGALEHLAGEHAATGAHHALAVLDLDHLKVLNDVYGHATGDAALRAVAERTLRVLRSGDLMFRYGGDEFVVLLPNTNLAEAAAVLRRVHDQVTGDQVAGAAWVTISLSIGAAASDEPGGSAGLFERADERVRSAKRGGRGRVVADDARRAAPERELAETRVIGRDRQLAAFDAFLAGADGPGRVLGVHAQRGAGVSRFLAEVEVRARQAGFVVRRLESDPAGMDVHLRALAGAYAGGGRPGDVLEDEVRERLRNDAEAHGLLLVVAGGRWLDPASAALVVESLRRGGTKLLEVVLDDDASAFAADGRVELGPLPDGEVATWLGAALGARLSDAVVAELAGAGRGLPGRIARLVLALVGAGVLRRAADGWEAEPGKLRERIAALREAPAAVGAAQPTPMELPRWEAPLVGRARWLAAARPAARDRPLVTLVGHGGAGKTRLAAQLALDLGSGDESDAPDGAYWVDLRAVDSVARLPAAIAEALGQPSVDDLEALAERLAGARVRLVLDNADALADEAGALSRLLERVPELRLLVTARRPLHIAGERVIEVPELTEEAAKELLRQGMRRVGADGGLGDEQLAELATAVGRDPLAIELAAAWTRMLSPNELLERLERRPGFLADAPDGQPQPLTERFIDAARGLMSPAEQQTLGTLALIPGGFLADDGRAASGASSFFLLALLERSLVRREGERYTVHAVVADRFRAGLEDEAGAKDAVARAYSDVARRLNALPSAERTVRGFKQVDAERANLEWSFAWSAGRADVDAAWPLAELLRGYFDVRGYYRQGAELFQRLVPTLAACRDVELLGWALEAVALYLMRQAELAKAGDKIAEAIALLEPAGLSRTLGMALNTAGIVASHGNRVDEALAHLVAAAEMRAALGDRFGEAQSRGNVAFMLAGTDRVEEAFDALAAAAERYREVGHEGGLALALAGMGRLASEHGLRSHEEALALATEAQAKAERLGFANGARVGATEVADILRRLGRYEDAVAAFERACHWARIEENEVVARDLLERLARTRAEAGLEDRAGLLV